MVSSSGVIGQNWAMLFAGAGYEVSLYDVDENQVTKALDLIKQKLLEYEEKGFLRGKGTAPEQASKVSGTQTLQECLSGAYYVQVDLLYWQFKKKISKNSYKVTRRKSCIQCQT